MVRGRDRVCERDREIERYIVLRQKEREVDEERQRYTQKETRWMRYIYIYMRVVNVQILKNVYIYLTVVQDLDFLECVREREIIAEIEREIISSFRNTVEA